MCPDPYLRRFFVRPRWADGEEQMGLGSNVIRFTVCQPDNHPDHEPAAVGRVVRLVVTRRLSRSGSELVVRVSGDVDLVTAATLARAFDHACRWFRAEPGGLGIVADLRAVSFLSAAGMRVLVGVRDACLAEGLDLRVVAAHAAVVAPLSLAGITRMLNLQADLPC